MYKWIKKILSSLLMLQLLGGEVRHLVDGFKRRERHASVAANSHGHLHHVVIVVYHNGIITVLSLNLSVSSSASSVLNSPSDIFLLFNCQTFEKLLSETGELQISATDATTFVSPILP